MLERPYPIREIFRLTAAQLATVPYGTGEYVTLYEAGGRLGYTVASNNAPLSSGTIETDCELSPLAIHAQTLKQMASVHKDDLIFYDSTDNDVVIVKGGYTTWYINTIPDAVTVMPHQTLVGYVDRVALDQFTSKVFPTTKNEWGNVDNPITLQAQNGELWLLQMTDGRYLNAIRVGMCKADLDVLVNLEGTAWLKNLGKDAIIPLFLGDDGRHKIGGNFVCEYYDTRPHPKLSQLKQMMVEKPRLGSITVATKKNKMTFEQGLELLSTYKKRNDVRFVCRAQDGRLFVSVETNEGIIASHDFEVVEAQGDFTKEDFHLFSSALTNIHKDKTLTISWLGDKAFAIGGLYFNAWSANNKKSRNAI